MSVLRSLTVLLALLFAMGISTAYADGISGTHGNVDRFNADLATHITPIADVNSNSFQAISHEPTNGLRDGYAMRFGMWDYHSNQSSGTSSPTTTPEPPTVLLLIAGFTAVFFLRRRVMQS
jgi:hypothetical protein